jgi:sRNA-binding carbon storage regulator CsrA
MVAIKAGKQIGIGDQVGVKMLERGGGRAVELTAPKQLAKELELGRGLGIGLGR